MSTRTTLIQHSTGSVARAFGQDKKIKGIQIGNEEVKVSLLADDMILIFKKTKRLHKKSVRNNNKYSKIAGYKNQCSKNAAFLYTNKLNFRKK